VWRNGLRRKWPKGRGRERVLSLRKIFSTRRRVRKLSQLIWMSILMF